MQKTCLRFFVLILVVISVNHLKKYCKLRYYYAKNGSNVEPVLDPTVSIFNIWHIDKIEKGFNNLGYSISSEQKHFASHGQFDPRILPQPIKDKLIKKYEYHTHWQHNIAQFLRTKNPNKSNMIEQMLSNIFYFDNARKENFHYHNKELYNEIKYYYESKGSNLKGLIK